MNCNERGFTLAGALTLIAVMMVLLAMAIPLWSRVKQRDNEEELVFRGKEYIEAISRYHQKFNAYPPDLDTLQKLKFIRKLYPDPMTKSGKWKVIHPDSLVQTGQAGKINQPGGQTMPDEGDDDDDDDDDDDSGASKKQSQDLGSDDQNKGDEAKDDQKDEEPEVESTGPVVGVESRSKKESMKVYNGQSTYNKWAFTFTAPTQPQKVAPGTNPGKGVQPKPGTKQNPPNPMNPTPPGTPPGTPPETPPDIDSDDEPQ